MRAMSETTIFVIMIFRKIWTYITFRKSEGPSNLNLKMMHGMNRISLLMFLAAIVMMVVKLCK